MTLRRFFDRNWLIVTNIIVVFVCIVVAFFIGTTPSSNPYDYPHQIIIGARALHGERPYADYAVVYGPLGSYITAAGLWMMQSLPLIQGFNLLFVLWTSIYVLYFTWEASKLARRHPFVFSTLVIYIIALMPIIAHYSYYSLVSILMLVAAIQSSRSYFDLEGKSARNHISLFILAAITVVTVLSRINFGAYILFSLALVTGLHLLVYKGGLWNSFARLVILMFLLGTIAAALLYFSGILVPYIQDMILFLPRYKARLLPINISSTPLEITLAIALLIVVLVAAIDLISHKLFGSGLMGTIILACLFQYCFQRLDVEHLYCVFLLLPFVCLAVQYDCDKSNSYAELAGTNENGWSKLRLANYILGTLLGLMLLIPVTYFNVTTQIIATTSNYWIYNYKNNRLFINDGMEILADEMKMLQQLAAEKDGDSEIFWGSLPGCCESTTQVGANLGLYLAQGRLPTTRIWYFDPCSTAHADIQQILIKDLEAKQFKRIAMQGLINPSLGYLPGNPPESRLFFDYVQSKYTLRSRYVMPAANRYYDIYVRNEVKVPPK